MTTRRSARLLAAHRGERRASTGAKEAGRNGRSSWVKWSIVLLLLATLFSAPGAEYAFPVANRGSYLAGTDVGVAGGIAQYRPGGASERTNLIDVTQAPYSADKTGMVSTSTAINSAIAAASANDVVYFPNGTYLCTTAINIGQGRSNITIRGESKAGAIIKGGNGGTLFSLGQGFAFNNNEQTVTGAKTQGRKVFAVTSSAGYTTGDLVRVCVQNEEDATRIQAGAEPTFSSRGFRFVRAYITTVDSVSAGQITVSSGIPWDATNLTLKILNMEALPTWRLERVGIEDLTIEGDGASGVQYPLNFTYCVECWVYNCDLTATVGISTSQIKVDTSYRCEFRTNNLHISNGASDGQFQILNASRCLIEDNIFSGTSAAMYNSGNTCENVYAYNFIPDASPAFYTAHDPYPALDYFEGNVFSWLKADHYHGNSARENFFRNWITSANYALDAGTFTMVLNRFCRGYLFVGNTMGVDGVAAPLKANGYPNINNNIFDGTSEMSAGDFPADWLLTGTLTTRTSDTAGVITMDSSVGQMFVGQGDGNNGPCLYWNSYANSRQSVEVTAISGLLVTVGLSGFEAGDVLPAQGTAMNVWPGALGFQEYDNDVENTLIQRGNFEATALGTGAIQNPLDSGDTLADSYVYASKPDYFGHLAWPPFSPSSPPSTAAGYQLIPAGYRYINGDDAPTGGGTTIGGSGTTTFGGSGSTTFQ